MISNHDVLSDDTQVKDSEFSTTQDEPQPHKPEHEPRTIENPTPLRPWTLITGATSGIGLAFSHVFAQMNHNLILVARDQFVLRELSKHLESTFGIAAVSIAQDLSKESAANSIYELCQNFEVEFLINNAGFAEYGNFIEGLPKEQVELIGVNIESLTQLTRLFLPAMVKRNQGGVLNVASTAAFVPGPLMATYYASKAYVLSLTEAIAEELSSTKVRISALCPGPTDTMFQVRGAMRDSKLVSGKKLMPPEVVAQYGYEQFMLGRRIIIPCWRNRLVPLMARFLPRAMVTRMVLRAQEPESQH